MVDDRRLKLARRQLLMAQIARREARHAFANAIAEEQRSADIDARSRDLLNEYATRARQPLYNPDGQALRGNFAFVRSLQAVARNAQQVALDAKEQSAWQARTLAAAEHRMTRHEERLKHDLREAEAELCKREAASELASGSGMARKLQSRS